jgi:hypothetical protein
METTIESPQLATKTNTGEPIPNPMGLKQGEVVIMDGDTDSPVEVEILSIGIRGHGASVRETVSNKRWSCSIQCLTRK